MASKEQISAAERERDQILLVLFRWDRNYGATVREVQQMTRTSSTSAVDYRLKRLREAGLVTYERGRQASITITQRGREHLIERGLAASGEYEDATEGQS